MSNGAYAFGSSWVQAYSFCGLEYGWQEVWASVQVSTDLGGFDSQTTQWPSTTGEAYVEAAAQLQPYEPGYAHVYATGMIWYPGFGYGPGEGLQGWYDYALYVPPPPPPDPPSLSLIANPVSVTEGSQSELTATVHGLGESGSVSSYSWEIVDDPLDPTDNPAAGQLVSAPSCEQQPQCVAGLLGAGVGTATVKVTAQLGEGTLSAHAKVYFTERPVLRIILDMDWTVNLNAIQDDAQHFIPGRYFLPPEDEFYGLTLPEETVRGTVEEPGYEAQLLAVFVMPSNPNVAVPPPAGVTQVEFLLEDTTAFKGYTSNAGWDNAHDDEPDYGLFAWGHDEDYLSSRAAGFQEGLYAQTYLRIRDYGGYTRVRATASNGAQDSVQLPNDANGNLIADSGWMAYGVRVADDRPSWEDVDAARCLVNAGGCDPNSPTDAEPEPPVAAGMYGDGLTRLEEYRGIRIHDVIMPMDPSIKDLFIAGRVKSTDGLTDYGLGFVSAFNGFPIRVHHIRGALEAKPPDYGPDRVINAFGRDTAGHYDQKAIQMHAYLIPTPVGGEPALGGTRPIYLAPNTPLCVNNGLTPNQTEVIHIDTLRLESFMPEHPKQTVDNNVKKTIGHEVGHAVHVKHYGGPPEICGDDGASEGFDSVMSSGFVPQLLPDWNRAKYNNADRDQIRLHSN
jgi:hypothetical protein